MCQSVTALTDLKAEPHDCVAVRARHPLDRPDEIALDQGPDDLAAAFDGKAVDHVGSHLSLHLHYT